MMRIPEGQDWLIERARILGYPARVGLCYGVAHMGVQAILTHDVAKFDSRLREIAATAPNKLEHKIKQSYLGSEPTLAEEILPFLDGVVLYQSPYKYTHLFESGKAPALQDGLSTSPLVMSKELKKLGGMRKFDISSGVYSVDELKKYLQIVQKEVMTKNSRSLAMVLSNGPHAITIGYDPDKLKYILIDANQLPSQYFTSESLEKMSEAVISAFMYRLTPFTIMAAEMFSLKSEEAHVGQLITNLKQNKEWQALHIMERDKLTSFAKGVGWLDMAARFGQLDTVNRLMDAGAKVVDERGFDATLIMVVQCGYAEVLARLIKATASTSHVLRCGEKLLHIAIQENQTGIAKILIDTGVKVNQLVLGATPLYLAAYNGNTDVARELINAGADVNISFQDYLDSTALNAAASCGHVKTAQLLINAGAKVDHARGDGATSLIMASDNGNDELVKMLIEANANVNKAQNDSATALFIAAQKNHPNVVKILIANNAKLDAAFTTTVDNLYEFAKNHKVTEPMREMIKAKNVTDRVSLTPLDIAAVMGNKEIVAILKNAIDNSSKPSIAGVFSQSKQLEEENTDNSKIKRPGTD
jgi:ankyrin repeat protein